MAKVKVRKSALKAGKKVAPSPGRPVVPERADPTRHKSPFGFTVSKSATPESNSKTGPAPVPHDAAGSKNGLNSQPETVKSQSGLDLTEKIKELVRLAQEQGYLTYS